MSKVSTSHTACTRARVTLSVLAECSTSAEIVFLNCAHNNASYRSALCTEQPNACNANMHDNDDGSMSC